MANKGFTLIELLAVIVILAVIALIATPIVLNIIADAREQAKESSAKMVFTGVKYAYLASLSKESTETSLGIPTLDTIKSNLEIDNVSSIKLYSNDEVITQSTPEKAADKLTIITLDGVTCDVTGNNQTGFTVSCDGYFTGDDAKTIAVEKKDSNTNTEVQTQE